MLWLNPSFPGISGNRGPLPCHLTSATPISPPLAPGSGSGSRRWGRSPLCWAPKAALTVCLSMDPLTSPLYLAAASKATLDSTTETRTDELGCAYGYKITATGTSFTDDIKSPANTVSRF